MDQMMVDVTHIPEAQEGDTVDLLGGDIPYMTYADWAHTNRNEAISILSRRPVRVPLAFSINFKISSSFRNFSKLNKKYTSFSQNIVYTSVDFSIKYNYNCMRRNISGG